MVLNDDARASIEHNARTYIQINFFNMANTHLVWSDDFPQDAGGDRLANPTIVGEVTDISIGEIKQDQGYLTVPFTFQVPADLEFSDGTVSQGSAVKVSGELWGEVKPLREYNDDPDYVDQNPNAFLYKAGSLVSSLA